MARQVSKKRTKPVTKGTKKTITRQLKKSPALGSSYGERAKNELLNVPVSAELYDALNDARPVGMTIGEFALSSAGQAVIKRYNEFIDECAGDSALHDTKIKISSPYGFNITGPWQDNEVRDKIIKGALADGQTDHNGPDHDDVFNGKQSAEASDILGAASAHLRARVTQRDQPDGERSMTRAVHAFNALFRRDLTEREGWMFMVFLKAARATNTPTGILDDYQDGAAYFALAGEAALKGSEG